MEDGKQAGGNLAGTPVRVRVMGSVLTRTRRRGLACVLHLCGNDKTSARLVPLASLLVLGGISHAYQGIQQQSSPPSSPTTATVAADHAAIEPGTYLKRFGQATPENALRAFLLAMMAHDQKTLHAVIQPMGNADFQYLIKGNSPSLAQRKELEAIFFSQSMKRLKSGDTYQVAGKHTFTIPSGVLDDDTVMLMHESFHTPWIVQRTKGLWFVDASEIVVGRKAMESYSNAHKIPTDPIAPTQKTDTPPPSGGTH